MSQKVMDLLYCMLKCSDWWLEPPYKKFHYLVTSILCERPLYLERPDVVHMDSAEVTGVKPAPVARYMHENGSK